MRTHFKCSAMHELGKIEAFRFTRVLHSSEGIPHLKCMFSCIKKKIQVMHHYGSQTWFLCVNLVREPTLLCVFILEAKTSSLAPPTGNTVNKTTTTTTTDRKVAFMIRLQKSGYRTHKETNRPRVWINIYCQSVYCDVYGGKVRTLKFRQQWDKCNMSSHERM